MKTLAEFKRSFQPGQRFRLVDHEAGKVSTVEVQEVKSTKVIVVKAKAPDEKMDLKFPRRKANVKFYEQAPQQASWVEDNKVKLTITPEGVPLNFCEV